MPRDEGARELARKRARRAKLKKLRARYSEAKTESEKEEIFAKARRISPFVEFE